MAATVSVFSSRPYDEQYLTEANREVGHELRFFEAQLNADTAVMAAGSSVVCPFVNDDAGAATLDVLADVGVRALALRSAGYNHVDIAAAKRLGLALARVPEYSPYSVAEHCVGLILSLNRRIHRAHNRVREGNFALSGLLGFDLYGKTVGIIGTGTIGARFAEIMSGFGMRLLAADPIPNQACIDLGVDYLPVAEVLANADIVSLHCPLTPDTFHLIDDDALALMRDGVMLINTSRGALIDTTAAIAALKSGKLGYLGLDVYEEEGGLFFEDLSDRVIQDDEFSRLLTFPNVLITGHQAFFTVEAIEAIARTTIENISAFERGERPPTAIEN